MIDPLELSKKLISCPSVTPIDAGALGVLEKALMNLGFDCMRMSFSENGTETVDNLYAKLGTSEPNLCFAGHTDVVPPGNVEDWTSDPFEPNIRFDILYGRGVVDMKCAIACFVSAVSKYLENNTPKGSISFLITGDEEGDAINGTKKVLKALQKRGEKIDACIVGEPTNPEKLGNMIKIGRRGSINFNLTIWGKQGHVAYPDVADNPVSRLNNILYVLNNHELDKGTEYFQPSNLEIVSIDVNNPSDNVIPNVAKAAFNIRFNNLQNAEKLVKWIDGICTSLCETKDAAYKLEHKCSGEAFLTKPGELSNIVSDAVKDITGETPELSTDGGTSDARFIKDYCPVVEFGLINKTSHKVDECVAVEDIFNLTKIYERVLERYFG